MDRETESYFVEMRENIIQRASEILGAHPAPGIIPGLWNAPGYPELTTAQMVNIAFPGYTGTPLR